LRWRRRGIACAWARTSARLSARHGRLDLHRALARKALRLVRRPRAERDRPVLRVSRVAAGRRNAIVAGSPRREVGRSSCSALRQRRGVRGGSVMVTALRTAIWRDEIKVGTGGYELLLLANAVASPTAGRGMSLDGLLGWERRGARCSTRAWRGARWLCPRDRRRQAARRGVGFSTAQRGRDNSRTVLAIIALEHPIASALIALASSLRVEIDEFATTAGHRPSQFERLAREIQRSLDRLEGATPERLAQPHAWEDGGLRVVWHARRGGTARRPSQSSSSSRLGDVP